jgi:hypothetical protein
MAIYVAGTQGPVTADDFDLAVLTLTRAVSGASEQEWRSPTRGQIWSTGNRLDHLLDQIFPLVVHLAARARARDATQPQTDLAPIGLKLAPRLPERGIADMVERVLFRLFPDVPEIAEPWPTFLWATGYGEPPGTPRQKEWHCSAKPRSEW